jgi:periplasmic protein TonB
MSHTLTARAASLGASSLMLSGLVAAALMATYTIREIEISTAATPVVVVRPPDPPPPQRDTTPPPRMPLTSTIPDNAPLTPIEPIRTTDAGATYFGPLAPLGPVEITAPDWLQRPRDLARYYPRRAIERNIQGEALLDCLVSTAGTLQCSVISESPEGWGFGAAALRIARDHRMAPAMSQGTAVEGRYEMRVPFEIRE